MRAMGFEGVVIAPRAPWQNPFVERVIGSLRRECLDHVIIWNERSLRRHLRQYLGYYHEWRTHLSLDKDAPVPRAPQPPTGGAIVQIPHLGGLHHHYERRATWPSLSARRATHRQPARSVVVCPDRSAIVPGVTSTAQQKSSDPPDGAPGRAIGSSLRCRWSFWQGQGLYADRPSTKRARSIRSISDDVMHFTPTPMQALGILILLADGAATS